MAESSSKTGEKLELNDPDTKNPDFSPPTIMSTPETKDVCGDCKIHTDTIKNLTLSNSKLQDTIENLRGVIKDLLVKTGRGSDPFDHLLTLGKTRENEGIVSKNLDNGAENHSAVQTALPNSLILQKIFGYFNKSSVLQFRSVCKFWTEEASVCLLKKKQVCIRLFYNNEGNTLGKPWVGMLPDLMNLLTSCFTAGRKFPCACFTWSYPSLVTVPDVQEFLEKFGYLLEEIALEFVDLKDSPLSNRGYVEFLRNLLFKWAPRLKRFDFGTLTWPVDDLDNLVKKPEDSASSFLTLPNLEVVSWMSNPVSHRIYLDLLKISLNLKKVATCLWSLGLKSVVEANKAWAIKAVQFSLGSFVHGPTSAYTLMSEHCFHVEEIQVDYKLNKAFDQNRTVLSFPEEWRSKVQLLNKVLQNNKNSVIKIECQNLGPLAEIGLQIPVMPNLKTLDITTDFNSEFITAQNVEVQTFFRIFPKGLDVASTFPNLAHISWKIELNDNPFDLSETLRPFLDIPILDTMGPLTSVRSLTVYSGKKKDIEFFRRIAVCLPNVKVLQVNYSEKYSFSGDNTNTALLDTGFPEILRIIWGILQNLESVHLLLYLKDPSLLPFPQATPPQLVDSAVTGLDLATVKKLARIRGIKGAENLADVQQKGLEAPSILNMKNLRYLKITLQSENDHPVFTHVSGTHGFGLMSNLIVVVEAGDEKTSVIADAKGLMSQNVTFYQLARKRKSR